MRPRYCCFYLHQRPRLGWVQAEAAGAVRLVTADGEKVRQRSANLLYCWCGDPAADDAAALAQLQAQAEALAGQTARVDEIYAAMTAGEPATFEALAARALAPDENGWARGLLFAALLNDAQRFRFSTGAFTARGAEEVAERAAAEREKRARQDWLRKVERWRGLLQAGTWDADDPDGPVFLAQLQSLLALERRSAHWNLLSRPLELGSLHALDLATRIKGWLQAADAWPDWPAIWLQWGEVHPRFAPPLAEAAAALARAPLRRDRRRDRTGDAVYTIDSESTRDFDDACAIVDADAAGLTVAVHIAEPDPALEPGHPLFEEAARRMTSVYTLEGIFPMFPDCLSTGRFSLVQGAEREALTFVLRIEEDGARLLEVERSLVRVVRNLDYAAGQALLDEDGERWGRLALLCEGLANARALAGAVIMERRDTVLDLSDPRRIRLREVVRSGPVYRLVEELAILHNREAGRYCHNERLPGIYRVQPPPRQGAEGGWGDEPEPRMAARFATRGAVHTGLACDRYIQTTSPIRRFPDLVMQRQIAEHAAGGRVTFPEHALLEDWAGRADARVATVDEVTRRITSDYKRRYLLQNRGRTFSGVAQRRRDADHGRVWLEPLHLHAQCVLPTGVKDGDRVRVRVEAVDRDHQSVWVACVE